MIPQCQGTKSTGARCGSPALRGKSLCYYHSGRPRKTPRPPDDSPLPDFRNPMKMLDWAMRNLAAGRISPKAAGQLIYAAQMLMR